MNTVFFKATTQNLLDNCWELVFLSCALYLLGIWWFFIRTRIQKDKFKIFLEEINSVSSVTGEGSTSLTTSQPSLLARLWSNIVLLAIVLVIFLISIEVFLIIFNLINSASENWKTFDFIMHNLTPYFAALLCYTQESTESYRHLERTHR